jgi:hypothetical protein
MGALTAVNRRSLATWLATAVLSASRDGPEWAIRLLALRPRSASAWLAGHRRFRCRAVCACFLLQPQSTEEDDDRFTTRGET